MVILTEEQNNGFTDISGERRKIWLRKHYCSMVKHSQRTKPPQHCATWSGKSSKISLM